MMKGRCRMLTSRLLILNQKEAECKEMAAYFQDSGYSVIWCTEYDEATEILSRGKNKPDLLIFDVDLPKRREYEALEKIRSLSDMAVLMLSQDDKLDSQLYAYSKKIDDYMVKPAPLPLLEGTLISFWVLVGFGTLGLPQTAVRSMGFKNTKSLHSAMWIGALTCSFIIVGMHMAGTWAGALVDTKNLPTSDYFIPYIVQKIMPVGLAGTFLAAPMAAVMSTADSLLILASAAIVKDLWRNYVVKDDPVKIQSYNKNVGKMSTLVTFAFGVIVILLTINPPDIIFFLNLFALGGLECSFFWPLVGGLFWKKGTKQAAVFSSLGAAITYVFCYYNVQIAGINAVVWGLLAGGILYFVIGNITCKNGLDEDIIKNCF